MNRQMHKAMDEVTRLVGEAPPVLPESLQGDTRLTGRWRHPAFDGEIRPMHEHCISAILSGTGPVSTWEDDRERKTTVIPGHVTIVPQGFEGRWCLKNSVEVCNVYLGPRRLQECADSVFGGRIVELDLRVQVASERLSAIMSLICAEVEGHEWHSRIFLEEAIELLCIELIRHHSTLKTTVRPTGGLNRWQLSRVSGYMHDRLGSDIYLDDLAGLLGLSRYHFCRSFRTATGQAPYEYLTRLRMDVARNLLADVTLRVIDVGVAVGYTSESRFCAAFRKTFGLSPRQYRDHVKS